jgi:hypothetical protein
MAQGYRRSVLKAAVSEKLVSYASRGKKNWFNRLCYRILERLLKLDPGQEFMDDDICNANVGYDLEELERYQKGEIEDTKSPSSPIKP